MKMSRRIQVVGHLENDPLLSTCAKSGEPPIPGRDSFSIRMKGVWDVEEATGHNHDAREWAE